MFRRGPHAAEVSPPEDLRFTDPAVPERSCCCPARPVVKVVMPPTADRPHPVDLWLCGHHYRASFAALVVAGARVEDLDTAAAAVRADHAAVPA